MAGESVVHRDEEAILSIRHNLLPPSLEEGHHIKELCCISSVTEEVLDSSHHPFGFDFRIFARSGIPINFYFSTMHSSFLLLSLKWFFLTFLKERVQTPL